MLFIDCDHDPVSGLARVSKALGKHKALDWHTGILYECVDYL
jgi:hypothetical protein